jgi:tight adherence protein B
VHAAVAGVIGSATVVACMRAARRAEVRDRLPAGDRTLRVPAPIAARIASMLDAAALTVTVEQACATWAYAVIVATVLGLGFGGVQAALATGAGAAVGIPAVVLVLQGRGIRRLTAAVPDVLDQIAAELRAGGTIATAVAAIATTDGPLAGDFARLDARVRLGATVPQGLQVWTKERRVPGVGACAGALALCATVGGPASDALEALASSLRGQIAVAAEARALSAQARMSAVVVGGAPLLYLAWSAVVDPHALHALAATPTGHACLVAGLALEVLGAWWMRRILRSGGDA